jgi:hypothetical protein
MEKASLQKVWEDMKHGVYNFTKVGKNIYRFYADLSQ